VTFGCVLLTMGRRPEDLRRALDSLLAQRGVETDIVVVGNEWEPTGLPDGVRGVGSPVNLGIPAGRNLGVPHTRGELLFFLDDDASLASPDALAAVARRFEADPSLGLLQLRVAPRDGGASARDWVPRLRVGDRSRSSDITAVWEGAVAMRRAVFDAVGGWPADFRFVHEGIDLGWRVMDAGHRVAYAGDISVLHPSPTGTPHGYSFYYGARNRVWLARRHLPLPLAVLYVGGFVLRTLPRLRSRQNALEALRGYRDGLRGRSGERKPLKGRTLWRMTRAGRPPIM
jgi:GT2 family glycosyltransferase